MGAGRAGQRVAQRSHLARLDVLLVGEALQVLGHSRPVRAQRGHKLDGVGDGGGATHEANLRAAERVLRRRLLADGSCQHGQAGGVGGL